MSQNNSPYGVVYLVHQPPQFSQHQKFPSALVHLGSKGSGGGGGGGVILMGGVSITYPGWTQEEGGKKARAHAMDLMMRMMRRLMMVMGVVHHEAGWGPGRESFHHHLVQSSGLGMPEAYPLP